MPNEDRIRKVYDLLTEAYDIPQPFEEVQNKWQTSPESRRKAYDLLTEAYEIQQPYEEFEQLFAPGYNEQGQAAATAAPSKPASKQGDLEGKTQPSTVAQNDTAARVVAGGGYTPRSIVPSSKEDWDDITRRAGELKAEEKAKKEQLEQKKAESVAAAQELQDYANTELRKAQREERKAKWRSLGDALLRSASAAPSMTATSAAVAGGMSPSQKMAMEGTAEAFKEYGEHKLVAEALDESIDYVNAVADQRGVGKGAWDYATRIGTFDFGYSGIAKGLTLQQLAEKAESGELLSEEEERVLDMVAQATYLTQLVQDGVKMGYNVGASLPQSLGFMVGIALNPASGLGRQMMKRAAKKYGERAFKTMAARALGDVAEMGIATLTTGSGRVLADAIDRVNGDVTYDITPEGYIAYGGQQNQEALWNAAAKAFGTNFIENYTEALGEYFSPLGNMLGDLTAKNLRRMNLGGLVDFINAIPQSQWGKMVGQFMEATKFNGVVGEILEEEIGMFLEPVFVGDSTLAENFNIWSDDPEIADRARDNQLTTILSCALMSGMLYGVQGAGARGKLNRELAHADREGKRLLGEEGWNNIHTLFDSADGDAEKLERLMKDVVYGKELTNEQRTAIVDYAAKMVQTNQFNASNDAAKQEMTKTASELSAAYDAGYRMATLDIPQNFRGVRDDLYWSEDAILEYDKNHLDINLLEIAHNLRDADMATREQVLQGLPSEQADLVKTYLACSERFNGLYQGTKDAMDADKMTFIDMVRPAIITNADGQEIVRTATTAYGESVYVVGGEGKVSYILDGNGQKSAYPTDQLKGLSETTVEELESQFDKALEDRYMARLEHYTQHNEQTQEPVVGMILGDGNENYVITDMGEGWATIQEAMTDKEGNMVPKPDGTSRDVTKDYLLAFQDQIYDRRDVMDGKPVPSSIPAALQQAADDKTEQVQALQQRAEQWAAATGVAADIYEKAEDIPDKQTQQFIMQQQEAEANGQQTEQIVTGWYDTKTGRIAFYLPNIKDESDLDRTYIHEVISHKGLRELLKDNSAQEGGQYWRFDNLMQRVWDELMTDTDRQQYMDYVKRFMTGDENKLQRAAADEFVASFSETLKLNPTDEVKTLWDKFVEFVRNILDTIGVGSSITNEDLSTLLQASMDRYREQVKQEHTPKDFRGNPLPMRTNKMTGEQVVNANALWQNDPEAWALWNDSQPNRLISSKERLEDSIADLDKQIKKENTALIAAAKKGVDEDKIDEMRYELDKKVKLRQTYQDILARLSQPAAAAETVAGQQRKAAAAETVASAAAGFAGIQENWNKAPKAVGLSDEIVLPNGEMIRGHYVLTEAWAPTPSHNPADGFKMSAGFPVDENGKTVNDRDYEHDKAAQQSVLEKAGNYDQRALQTPVIVTADGVVLSGNDRTMASQLAATGGTDQAYTDYLGKYAQKYGFTAEQVGSMEHPRVLFVPDVPLGYNAATFAKFNAEEKKSQNKVESAVKAGKTISPAALGKLAALVNGYEDINALYNDENGANDLIGIMLEDGYITQEQVAALKEGSKLSGTGMDFLESTLIGAALEEDAVRIVMDDRSMRHSIVSAISQIIANSTIEDYNLRTELADAIALVAKGKASKVIKFGDTVQDYIRQGNLFEKDVVAEATVQLLADALNNKKTTTLKKVLSLYNTRARDAANGQMSIFSGDVETKYEILVQILNDLGYATRTFDTFKRAEAAREGQDSAGAESGEAGDAGDGERPGEVNRNREFVRAALMESGDEYIDLTDYMSDDECDEFMRLYEEYEPFQDAVGEAYEKYDKQLNSKDKAKKAAAEKKIDKLVKAQEKAFEPIQDYVEDLLSKYGLADVDEVETEEEVPEISVERPGTEGTEVAEEQLASEEEVEKQTYTPDEWEDFVYGGFCGTFESPRSNVRYKVLFVDDRFNIYKNHSVKLRKETKDGKSLGEAGGTTDYILKYFKANGYKRVSGGSVKNKYGFWINQNGCCTNPVRIELPSVKKGWAQMNEFTYYRGDDNLWYGGGSMDHGDGGGSLSFSQGYENRSDLVKAAIEKFEKYREQYADSKHYTMRDVDNLIKELKNRTLPQTLREEGVLTTPAPAPVQGELFGMPKKKVVKKVVKKKGKKTAKKTTVKKETTQENDIEKMTSADVKARGLKMGDKVKFRGQTAKVHHITNLKGEPYSVEIVDNNNEHYLVLVNDTSAPVEATQEATSAAKPMTDIQRFNEELRTEIKEKYGSRFFEDEQNILNVLKAPIVNNLLKEYAKSSKSVEEVIGKAISNNWQELALGGVFSRAQKLESARELIKAMLPKEGEDTRPLIFGPEPLIKGDKWAKTGEPQKWKAGKKSNSHDTYYKLGNKTYGLTKADSDAIYTLAEDYGSLSALWNAYENGRIILFPEQAAAVKAQLSYAESQQSKKPKQKPTESQIQALAFVEDKPVEQVRQELANPSGNKLVTDEQYEKLRERMRQKLNGQMNMGVDPEIFSIGVQMAVYHIEKGARKFVDFAKAMIDELGDAIRPYLKSFYNGARDLPEMQELAADMDSYEVVSQVDTLNFDKSAPVSIEETAENSVKERESVKNAEKAKKKILDNRSKTGKQLVSLSLADGTEMTFDKNDYQSFMTPEAKSFFETLAEEDEEYTGRAFFNKKLAYITYASDNGAIIPADVLEQLPEFIAAEQRGKELADINGGPMTLSDVEREAFAKKLLTLGSMDEKGKFTNPVAQEKKAFIVIGRPAGGKSSVFADPLSKEHNARIIDSDIVKEWLFGYEQGLGSGYVQEASASVADAALLQAALAGDNMVIPRIGGPSVISEVAIPLRSAGYTVELLFNEVPERSSIMRAASRFARTGRYLSLQHLQSIGDKPLNVFKKFGTLNIGEAINELSEKQVQKLRGRIESLSGKTGESDGTGRQAGNGSGQETLGADVQTSLGTEGLGSDLLNSTLFNRAEWKNNDVPYGEQPKLISSWSSQDRDKTEQSVPTTPQAGDQLTMWDLLDTTNNDNDTETTQPTQGESEADRTVGGVSAVGDRVLGSEGPGQSDGGEAAGNTAGTAAVAGTEQGPVRTERSGGGSEGITDLGGEEQPELSDGGPSVRSGNAAAGRSAVRRNLKESGEVKKASKPSKRYTRNFSYDSQSTEIDNYTPQQRYKANVEAVEVVAKVLTEGRSATDEEKVILSRFRGWGGVDALRRIYNTYVMRSSGDSLLSRLAIAIDTVDPDGTKGILEAIRTAALTSFYTPSSIARSMNRFVTLAGFKGGSLLDPSMGSGIFEGTMEQDVAQRTMIYGVEKDWLTGQIAKLLYPDGDIKVMGFEEANVPMDAYDVVESNIPFGDFKVADTSWKGNNTPVRRAAQHRIHNYFAVKMLESTKPGGICVIMTSNAILDTPGNAIIREHIADQSEVVGVIRLPDNTFKGAGTAAVTDVIMLRKFRDEVDRNETRDDADYRTKVLEPFLSTVKTTATADNEEDYEIEYNGYFGTHKDYMIGDVIAGNQYRHDAFGLTSKMSTEDIAAAMDKLTDKIVGKRKGKLLDTVKSERAVYEAVREAYVGSGDYISNGNLVEQDGKFGTVTQTKNKYGETSSTFEELTGLKGKGARLRAMFDVRTAMKKLIAKQIEGVSDDELKELRGELQKAYDKYVKLYGRLNDAENSFIDFDIDAYTLRSLEKYSDDKFVGLSDIFTKNTIKPAIDLSQAKDAQSTISVSLAEYGEIRPAFMENILGEKWFDLCKDFLFEVPFGSGDEYATRDAYLSGDVKTKLEQARRAADADERFERNVKALEEVQPRDLAFEEISIRMGARWVPQEVYTDFMFELFGLEHSWRGADKSGVRYSPEADMYTVAVETGRLGGEASNWSTNMRSAKDIFEAALEDRTITVKVKDSEGNEHIDIAETEAANQKVQDMRQEFEDWLPRNADRVKELTDLYNDKFNRTVIRKFDGSHLQIPGLMGMELRPHQKDAVWMLINNRGGIVDHMVGAGKTLVMQSAIMEMRRMGIAKKPMIVALKSTVAQITKDFIEAYPSARVLAPTERDFEKKNRKKLLSNIALNDYDCIIVSHDQYVKLPHTEEVETAVIREQLDMLQAALAFMYGTSDTTQLSKRQIKAVEKRIENLKAKMAQLLSREVDREFTFEGLGIDYLFVDECQAFKSLPYVTSYGNVSGLGDATGSQKAVALLNGVRYLQQLHQGDMGTTFLSGTTITNSLVEIYNLLNYLRPREMRRLGLTTFDAWANTFAEKSSELEYGVTTELKSKARFRRFDNVPELSRLYAEIADVRNDMNLKLPKPQPRMHIETVPTSDKLKEINQVVIDMVKRKNGNEAYAMGLIKNVTNEKSPYGLLASGISTKAAISLKLLSEDFDDEGGKVGYVCENVAKIYQQFNEQKGTQLIFCDTGVPGTTPGKYNVYDDIIDRLTKDYGIPREEVVDIHVADTDKKRKELFQKVREGKVRILIGGTKNMGTGVNVQTRVVAMHHIDVPWTPADREQREGRGVRQGNEVAKEFNDNMVDIYFYAAEESLDVYKYQLQDIKGRMFTQFKMGTIGNAERSFDEGSGGEDGTFEPAEVVALLSGNPVILEKSKQDKLVEKLRRAKRTYETEYRKRKADAEKWSGYLREQQAFKAYNSYNIEQLERNGFVKDAEGKYPVNVIVEDASEYGTRRSFDKAKDAGEYIHRLLKKPGAQVRLSGYGQTAYVRHEPLEIATKPGWEVTTTIRSSIPYRVKLSDDDTAAGSAFRSLLERVINSRSVYQKNIDEAEHKLQGLDPGEMNFPKQAELDAAEEKKKQLDAEYKKLSQDEDKKLEPPTPDGTSGPGSDRESRAAAARALIERYETGEPEYISEQGLINEIESDDRLMSDKTLSDLVAEYHRLEQIELEEGKRGYTGSEMTDMVESEVLPRLRALSEKEPGQKMYRMVTPEQDAYNGKSSQERSHIQYQKAQNVLKALQDAGFKDFYISRSINNFGVSTYIQGMYGLKFRLSDHSVTSYRRIMDEEHVGLSTPDSYFVDIAKEAQEISKERARKFDEREEKERKLDEKWERIKSLFEGLGWKTNDRTYQNFEEFSSNKKRSNILQTPLGIGRNWESAYRYEWTEPIDAYTKSKPSYEWLENFDEELSKVNTTMFRMITPEMDKQYAEAYERGDTELAESMVRDAFKAVYPNTKVVDKNGEPLVVEHATNADFTEFDIDYLGKNSKDKGLFGAGFYFGTHAPRWLGGTKNTMKVFLGMNKPFEIDDPVKEENKTIYHYLVDKFDIPALRALALTQYKKSINLGEYIDIIKAVDAEIERGEHDEKLAADEEIQNSYRPQDKMPVYRYQLISKRAGDFGSLPNSIQYIIAEAIGSEEFSAALKEGGYDGVIADRSESYKEYVAFYPSQIKSAEPFTLDDNGKLIPLSQRFQPESSDIRYRMKLQQAEQETDTNPTDGQKEAGNYKKGHVRLFGMDLSIEQPKGSVRRGTDPDGKEWEQEMHNTYGYIRGTMGRDKDHIDVFLGDNLSSDKVFVVDQRNIQNGGFDEHKVMLGFDDIEAARDAYYSNYEDGWTGLGAITETSLDAFKAWTFKEGRRVQPFSQTEGDGSVLFRMREPSEYKRIEDALGVAAVRYERAMDEAGKRMAEVMSDSMRSVKELQDAIAEQTGRPIRDYENAYWAAIQYSSRNKAMQDAYHKKFYRPLLDEVYSLTKDAKDREEALDKLNAYLMAKHGLERNEKFAMRDAERDALEQLPEEPRTPDEYDSKYAKWKSEFDRLRDTLYDKYRRRDYSGLTALFEKKKVVEAEIDAQLLVDSYEKEHDTAELWRLINAATKETLRTSVQGGVITQEKYIELANMFDNYVPLRGFDETTSDDVYGYYGTVNSPYNTAIKKAYGRRSLSDSPLATIGNIADSEIMRANRNRIYMTALSLAENHHTGLMSVSEVMFRRDPDTGEWSIALPDLSDADTPEEVAQKMSDFRKWFAEQLLTDDVNYRLSSEMARVPYKVINKSALDEHQIIAMRGGKQYIITVNGNPRAAQALAGKTNPDSSSALEWLAPFNRYLAAVYTQYNPSFVLRNLTRDGIYTNAMVWAKEDRKYALAFNKNWLRVLENMAGLLSKYKSELLDDSQPIERYFREFIDNGGETGYTQLRSVKDYKKIMKRELKDIASASPAAAGRKVMSVLGEAVENMNRWAEGVSRYAAFLTSREQGRSVVRSVEDAKEISVNFNKKGSGTAALTDKDRDEKLLLNVARVSQLGRELFVFFNAGVQGMANFTGIVKNNPQKAVPLLTGLFLGGAALAMMNGGGGDDDDEKEYYNLPEYIRRSNICLKAGKHWLTVPMPIELRCFYGLGELAYSVMSGNEFYEGKELAYEVASQLTQLLPIDFLEGNQGTKAFVPSAVKPWVEAYLLNQDWTGTPIYNDSPFNENDPNWRKAFKSTSPALVTVTRKLNEWTGGNVGRKGVINFNPARIEHWFEGYLGGVGTIMNQAYKSGRALTGDLDMREVRNIPVVSGFMRDSDGKAGVRAENSRYHKINDMVDGIINEDRRLRQVLAEKEISGYDYDDKVMKEAAERLQELRGSKEWEFAQQWRSMDKARTAAREGRDEEAFNKLTKEMNDIYIQFKRADND